MTLTDIANSCGTDKGDWQGFMPLYERYLPGPDTPVKLVELGVYRGQSLRLWATHFRHQQTQIWGVDITLALYAQVLDGRVHVVEGDQADEGIARALSSFGLLDVVVDDASHEADKTIGSFAAWWPHIKSGGLYVIEDTHCSYNTDHYVTAAQPQPLYDENWQEPPLFEPKPTLMDFVKRLADDVNWGIHGYNRFEPMYKDIAFVHFYPGIAFIGKKAA